jgi:YD repeat-containing protein
VPVTLTPSPASLTIGVNHVSACGPLVAAGGDDGCVSVWRDGTPAWLIPVADGSLVNTVAIAPNRQDMIAYGTFSGRIGVVDLSSPVRDIPVIHGEHPVNRVAWNAAGDLLSAADYEGTLRTYVWDGHDLTVCSAYRGHDGAIKDFCWVDEKRIVTISTDRTAHLVSVGLDSRLLRTFGGHGDLINSGSVTCIGGVTVLATASRDRTIRLFNLESGELLNVLSGPGESVKSVAWHPGGEPRLLSGSYDFTARVWTLDPADWGLVSTVTLDAHTNAISSVAWSMGDPITGSWDGRVLRWSSLPGKDEFAAEELIRPVPTAQIVR